jgi:hypothetical protein
MPISVQTPYNSYTGNGSTKTFPYTFKLLSTANLEVYKDGVIQSTGFTITGVGNATGGNVNFTVAPATDVLVEIKRVTPLDRSTDYLTSGSLEADTLDADFDRLVMQIQDINYNSTAPSWNNVTNTPTTIAGYGITDSYTKSEVDGMSWSWSSITGTPTTLAGYGITDAASSSHTHTFASLTSKPTTLAGYGITDAASSTHDHAGLYQPVGSYLTGNQSITLSGDASGTGATAITVTLSNTGTAGTYTKVTTDSKGRVSSGTTLAATDIPNLDWAKITTGRPTTLTGYGITDAQPLDADLTSIAGLAGATGLARKTALNTWSLDTNTYLTANQTVTLSGDVTGSGTTAITATLATVGIAKGGTGQTTANAAFNALVPSQATHSGKYLTTNGTNTSWATVSGGSSTLATLTDVTLTSPTNGQSLVYNGTVWVNQTVGGSGGGDAYLANSQTFTGANTLTGTTKLTTALIGGGSAMNDYPNKGFAHSFWGSGVEVRPNLNDFEGNHLMWADKRGYTLTTTGPITSPTEPLRQGNTYATITNTANSVFTVEGAITADSNVNAQRVFLQAHGSITANLLVEIKRSDSVWVTLSNEAIALAQFQYWFSPPIINAAAYPTYWNILGVRFTISGLTQATSYVRQLGVYKPNSFYQPWMTVVDPVFSGQTLAPDGTAALPSYTFSSDTNTGMYRVGTDTFALAAGGKDILKLTGSTSSVNFLTLNSSSTGAGPLIDTDGTDANIPLNIDTKGTGSVNIKNGGATGLVVTAATGAANYCTFAAQGAGSYPQFIATGTDTNIGMDFVSKGSGAIRFATNASMTNRQFQINNVASAVNYITANGAATAGAPYIRAEGTDTNIAIQLASKGTGAIVFNTNYNATRQAQISHVASAVNYLDFKGSGTGGYPAISALGSDTDIGIQTVLKNGGYAAWWSNNYTNQPAFKIAPTTTTIANTITVRATATANNPIILTDGTDANVGLNINTKGTGDIVFNGYGLSNLLKFDMTFEIQTGANATFTLNEFAGFKFTINSARFKTDSGTISAAVAINGTNVTGLAALALTSTQGSATATAANTVNAGNRVTIVTSANSTAVNAVVTLACTRVV